jgi:4-amino-4-deoxy-L-arabinose transferase-like glycosyltransferase
LLAVLLFGFALIAAWNCARPAQDDELRYIGMADALLGRSPGPITLWSPPGYAAFLMPFRAAGFGPAALRLLNAALLAAAVFLFYRLLRAHVAPRLAAAGAAAFALYWPFWKMLPEVMTETLAVFLMTATLLAWSQLRREGAPRWPWILVAALALAWICLTRAIFGYALLLCAALFAAALLTSRRAFAGRLLVTCVLAAALCAPWLGYTWSRTGRPFFWSAAGNMSLYWMTVPVNPWGDWHSPGEVVATPEFAPIRNFFARTMALPEQEQDEAFRNAALKYLRMYPELYARNVAANAGRLFFNTPYSFTPQKMRTLFFAVPNAFLLVLLTLALLALARRRDRWPDAAPPILLGGAALAGTLLLSAFGRMLLPIVPAMLFVIVLGLQDLRLAAPPPDAEGAR